MAATNSNRRSARNQEAPAKPDQLRSLDEWKKFPVETLKLKCDANRLPNKGKKLELSLRLFQHFHPDGVARVRNRNRQKQANKGDKPTVRGELSMTYRHHLRRSSVARMSCLTNRIPPIRRRTRLSLTVRTRRWGTPTTPSTTTTPEHDVQGEKRRRHLKRSSRSFRGPWMPRLKPPSPTH